MAALGCVIVYRYASIFYQFTRPTVMFTGLIDHCGKVTLIETLQNGLLLSIESSFDCFEIGESVAVDGVCLTVVSCDQGVFNVEVSAETRDLTLVPQYQVGTEVNLEKTLTLSQGLAGHLLTGHVDAIIKVCSIERQGEFRLLHFSSVMPSHLPLLNVKGSVALNGVSLTVNTVSEAGFSVMLIPHTLEKCNLSNLQVNDSVNIEFDMIAKMIERQLSFKKDTMKGAACE